MLGLVFIFLNVHKKKNVYSKHDGLQGFVVVFVVCLFVFKGIWTFCFNIDLDIS